MNEKEQIISELEAIIKVREENKKAISEIRKVKNKELDDDKSLESKEAQIAKNTGEIDSLEKQRGVEIVRENESYAEKKNTWADLRLPIFVPDNNAIVDDSLYSKANIFSARCLVFLLAPLIMVLLFIACANVGVNFFSISMFIGASAFMTFGVRRFIITFQYGQALIDSEKTEEITKYYNSWASDSLPKLYEDCATFDENCKEYVKQSQEHEAHLSSIKNKYNDLIKEVQHVSEPKVQQVLESHEVLRRNISTKRNAQIKELENSLDEKIKEVAPSIPTEQYENVDRLLKVLKGGRADGLKEAINVVVSDRHNEHMEDLEWRRIELEQERINRQQEEDRERSRAAEQFERERLDIERRRLDSESRDRQRILDKMDQQERIRVQQEKDRAARINAAQCAYNHAVNELKRYERQGEHGLAAMQRLEVDKAMAKLIASKQ